MTFDYLSVFTDKTGTKYRVYIVGRPEYHIMDWRGCNFKRLALPRELRKTFTNETDAKTYLKEMETREEEMIRYASSLGYGASFDESLMVL
jgi:hypothetical protein